MFRNHHTSIAMFTSLVVVISSLLMPLAVSPTLVHAAPTVASCAPDSGTATISGTVTGNGGALLNGVIVTAYTTYGQRGGYAYTNASGVYQITGLIGGSYLLKFEPQSGAYASEWYNNKPDAQSATPVVVADAGAVTGIDAQLAAGAQFNGIVSGEGSGPLQSVRVSVYNAEGDQVASTYTTATGVYTTAPGLPNGTYRIGFEGTSNFLSSYYNNKPTLQAADPLVVTTPTVISGIDASLERGGVITGTVTNAVTGLPIGGISVSANGQNDSGYDYTDANGHYAIDGLSSGIYDINAAPSFNDINLVSTQVQTATVVAPNTVANINLTMAPGGTLTGRVTDTGGTALKDITVFVGNNDGSYQRYVYTNATGVYTTTGLPSGQFKVLFRPSSYIPEAYNDHPDFDQADPITVTAPNTVTGIDAVLAKGASISGKVTEEGTGTPIKNVFVEVLDLEGRRVETASTQADGTYKTETTLASGQYLVRFNSDERFASCAFVTEYYNNQFGKESATKVTVSAPTATTNIDAAMTRGSIIFGKLTDAATGAPITSGQVTIYDTAGDFVMFGRLSFLGGWHTETALPSGNYRVKFSDYDSGYIDEFYNDKPTLATADEVTLTAHNDLLNIDAALAKGATISGRVTAADTGAPFTDGSVVVYDSAGEEVGYSYVDSDGNYNVQSGLASGSYRVAVVPYGAEGESLASVAAIEPAQGGSSGNTSGYTTTFYGKAITPSAATTVSLTAPTATNNINITMLRGTWLPIVRR